MYVWGIHGTYVCVKCVWSVGCMQCVVIECVYACGSIHGMFVGYVCMYVICVVSVDNYG